MIRCLPGTRSYLKWLRTNHLIQKSGNVFPNRNLLITASAPVSSKSLGLQNKAATADAASSPFSARQEDIVLEQGDQDKIKAPEGAIKEYKKSFGKEIFLGNFDYDLMEFPEVLQKEQHETLHEMLEPIERFFSDKSESKTNKLLLLPLD